MSLNRFKINHVSRLYCKSACLHPPASSPLPPSSSSQSVPTSSANESETSIQQLRSEFETLIGLNVCCKLNVNSKLFSRSSTNYFTKGNSNVSLFDCAIPGSLPIVNKACLELAIKCGLAFNCQINSLCSFDREHLFRPDYPSGYRIVQQNQPIARDGSIQLAIIHKSRGSNYLKAVKLKSLHLEEDIGRLQADLLHKVNFVNLNDRGVPLIKFVFEPELTSSLESLVLVRELMAVLKRMDVCTGKLEERAISIEATVQTITMNDDLLVEPVTIKNITSYHCLITAINYEIFRQKNCLRKGFPVEKHIQFYNPYLARSRRDWKEVFDSRLMPEPSLPTLICTKDREDDDNDDREETFSIQDLKKQLPSLPEAERYSLMNQYSLPLKISNDLVNSGFYHFFVKMMELNPSIEPIKVAEFIKAIVNQALSTVPNDVDEIYDRIHYFSQCFALLRSDAMTVGMARTMAAMWLKGDNRSPEKIMEENEWNKIEDDQLIEKICKEIIADRPTIVFLVKRGDRLFINNLLRKVEERYHHRISKEKISATLERLVDDIDKDVLRIYVTKRALPAEERPDLFVKNE